MKTSYAVISALALGAGILTTGNASANFINGIDVGQIDPLLAETTRSQGTLPGCDSGGNPEQELCWINNVLTGQGLDPTTYNLKTENVGYQLVDGSESVIGFELTSPSEFFLVMNANWYGLFSNLVNLNWAVIDTQALASQFNLPDSNPDKFVISHVATIGGDTARVPAPGVLGLLGAGLLGLGLVSRRKDKVIG